MCSYIYVCVYVLHERFSDSVKEWQPLKNKRKMKGMVDKGALTRFCGNVIQFTSWHQLPGWLR